MREFTIIAATIAFVGLSNAAFAQGPMAGGFGGGAPVQSQSFDSNEDLTAVFVKADANHDGEMTEAEYVGSLSDALKSVGPLLFSARDRNADGQVSEEEYTTFGVSLPSEPAFGEVDVAAIPAVVGG